MQYMTPDLLARARSEDGRVTDVAAAEWEDRGKSTGAIFNEVRPHLLPAVLRRD